MDTISRESSSSILPIGSLIAAIIGLVLAAVALFKVSSINRAIEAQGDQVARVEALEAQVRTAVAANEKMGPAINTLRTQTNDAFQQVAAELGNVRAEIAKAQETAKAAPRPTAPASGGSSGPVVAGPDEYVVKSGDIGTRIAQSNGVTLAELMAVNPGVNWNALHVGQRLKLPKK